MEHIKIVTPVKIFTLFLLFATTIFLFSCKTIIKEPIADLHDDFLNQDATADELFRVLIISDRYSNIQMKFHDQIKKVQDEEGDKNTCNKLKEYDKINEICEGILTVWLYNDSGKLMKIRPKILAPIAEINTLIVEDIKRWNFDFSGDIIQPTRFNIKYRVVLRKIQSDEEIMKEVIEREKNTSTQKGKSNN